MINGSSNWGCDFTINNPDSMASNRTTPPSSMAHRSSSIVLIKISKMGAIFMQQLNMSMTDPKTISSSHEAIQPAWSISNLMTTSCKTEQHPIYGRPTPNPVQNPDMAAIDRGQKQQSNNDSNFHNWVDMRGLQAGNMKIW
ncbi:hypothetical protein ACLOJK_035178 [Asimina triloba]